MKLKPGMRLHSTACSTEVVVVRATDDDVDLTCCGGALEEGNRQGEVPVANNSDEATLLGKRYTDEVTGIELLCTKAGLGPLACDGRVLGIKSAKPLPSSD
jgi:hypothetical protein